MLKNMKIEINEYQHLNEVVKELERLGYKKQYESDDINYANTFSDGAFGLMTFDVSDCDELTTITQLKEL